MELRKRGFTLLELLLAIALVALIMGIAYGVVFATVQAQERVEEVLHGSEIGPAILGQIRQDLSGAFAPDKEQDWFVGQNRPGAAGDRDRVDFVSSVPVLGAESPMAEPKFHAVNEIGYQVKDSTDHPGELALYRRVDLFVDAEPLRGGRLTIVADRVLSFDVTYWSGSDWAPDWISSERQDRLPEAVRIQMRVRVPDRTNPTGHSDRSYATVVPMARP